MIVEGVTCPARWFTAASFTYVPTAASSAVTRQGQARWSIASGSPAAGIPVFTGCPVAADGRLYMTAETGMTYVVLTGPEYELLEMNPLGEYVLSTPAIAGG